MFPENTSFSQVNPQGIIQIQVLNRAIFGEKSLKFSVRQRIRPYARRWVAFARYTGNERVSIATTSPPPSCNTRKRMGARLKASLGL